MNAPQPDDSRRAPIPTDHASLEARLRAEARAARVSTPEGLEERISAAVWRDADAPRAPARRARPAFLPGLLAGLGAAACIAAAVLLLSRQDTPAPEVHDEDIRQLVHAVQGLPARVAASRLALPERITAVDPLTREFAGVRADARSALDFLAANFLPSDALAPFEDTTDALPAQES